MAWIACRVLDGVWIAWRRWDRGRMEEDQEEAMIVWPCSLLHPPVRCNHRLSPSPAPPDDVVPPGPQPDQLPTKFIKIARRRPAL